MYAHTLTHSDALLTMSEIHSNSATPTDYRIHSTWPLTMLIHTLSYALSYSNNKYGSKIPLNC